VFSFPVTSVFTTNDHRIISGRGLWRWRWNYVTWGLLFQHVVSPLRKRIFCCRVSALGRGKEWLRAGVIPHWSSYCWRQFFTCPYPADDRTEVLQRRHSLLSWLSAGKDKCDVFCAFHFLNSAFCKFFLRFLSFCLLVSPDDCILSTNSSPQVG